MSIYLNLFHGEGNTFHMDSEACDRKPIEHLGNQEKILFPRV